MGFDWIWLLSVWQTGAAAQVVSRTNPEWRREFKHTLEDLTDAGLRQLSGLIVEIDEMQETPGADARDHAAARAAFEELLSRSGARFQEPFEAALHASPDVAGAYARLQRALEALPEPRSEDLTALHERRLKWGAPRRRASADRSNESS